MGKLMTKLNRMKRTILFYVLCVFTLCTYAQGISVSAPSHVATGENFRLTYSINAQSVDDFRAANIPSGLEVIAAVRQVSPTPILCMQRRQVTTPFLVRVLRWMARL